MNGSVPIRIADIQREVCAEFGVTREHLIGPDRSRRYVVPRHMAMFIARQHGFSYPRIGRAFGYRHHTTIIHAVRIVDELSLSDNELRSAIDRVRQKLGAP